VALNKANQIPNDGIANPYISINTNITSFGDNTNTPNRGATSVKPAVGSIGDQYFDTTTNVLQVYTTNGWVAAATKPDAPTNVVAVSAQVPYGGLPGVKVTWTPATTNVPASYYVITSNTGGFSQTTTTNQATFLGLATGTAYTFTVTATNNYGTSSATSNSITPVTVPQAPTVGTPTATFEGLSVPVTAGATGGSAITGYTLYAQPGNIAVTSATSPVVFKTNVPITGGPISINTRYSFSGTANNIAGASTFSNNSTSELDRTRFVTTGLTADYDFYRGSYGGQNTALWSEDFTQTVWSKVNSQTVTPNAITDPIGGNTGTLNTGNDTTFNLIEQGTIPVGTGAQTVSIYAKAYNNINYFTFNCYWYGEGEYNVDFYLDGSNTINGAPNSSGAIEDVGGGWYKCSFVVPARSTGTTGLAFRFWPAGRATVGSTRGTYFWGAQVKAAGTAAGYLKTTSASINYNTGSTIYDLSGNGYNATASNSTFTNTLAGGALVFNGTTTSVPLPNLGTGITNYTWSSWTRIPIAYLGGRMLIGGSAGYQYGDASWNAAGIGEYYYPHAINQFADVWLNTTIVVSGSNTITIYHNGYLEGSTTLVTATTSFASVTLATGFGGSNSGYTWGGNLGRLSFYIGKALTAAEVLQNFNADRIRYGV